MEKEGKRYTVSKYINVYIPVVCILFYFNACYHFPAFPAQSYIHKNEFNTFFRPDKQQGSLYKGTCVERYYDGSFRLFISFGRQKKERIF